MIIMDMIFLAFMYQAGILQSMVAASWSAAQVLFLMYINPYNSFQRNLNAVIVAFVKFFIFFVAFLNKAVGRESKDVAGPFSDFCGPLMIMAMMSMIGSVG